MLVLVLDSATPAVTAALGRVEPAAGDRPPTIDGNPWSATILARRATVDARAHGERLAPQIDAVLGEAGAKPGDLGAIVAGIGPGPFTGLRVGLVTATALGDALGIPTYPVCTLDAFAVGRPGRVLVATDARRREIYWACYADGVRLAGPEVSKPVEVAGRAAGLGARQAVGDGALRYADQLDLPVLAEPRFPQPAAMLSLAVRRVGTGAPGEPLIPLYLRRPDTTEPVARKRAAPQ
ncbi:MAG: tRNA (adenosine(37)-N6)-threonylcarbamoyltransferase complex dimerization subunit type 1 TsaB [Dactylosporangium sp.]|nr:tRNA (adenosine(37)-N6)-threonylcarbamoyltransferase complex dimerization subunit type 1 TsaB [Dactylosporangium sp.]NNJ59869.1 tRNA (adenosine(37)-N6)-threonylcarbamoyltransferase complex dimerization subunit type 1 TsaB [Dactylosporangium sp.]